MKSVRAWAAATGIALALLVVAAPFVPHGAQPADAGEFQLVARELGIAHPPGYPAYTMSAHIFGRIVGALLPDQVSPALKWPFAVNLFSTALALATLAVVALAGRVVGGSWKGALIAVAIVVTCPTFISLALVANVRMATALLTAVVLLFALRTLESNRTGQAQGLVGLGIAFGLAAGHHPSLLFLAPPIGLALGVGGVLNRQSTIPILRASAAAAVAWFVPQLYLPIRDASGAVLGPGDLTEGAALWRFVTGTAFRSDLLGASHAGRLLDRTRVVFDVHVLQFGVIGLTLAGIGLWRSFDKKRRPAAILLGGSAAVIVALAIVYRAPQTVEYLMPAYVAIAILASASAGALVEWIETWTARIADWDRAANGLAKNSSTSAFSRLFVGVVVIAVFARAVFAGLPGAAHEAVSRIDPIIDRTLAVATCASDATGSSTQTSARPTTILAAWHWATPLWLAADKDSTNDIRYVAPDWETGDSIGVTWQKQLDLSAANGPVILTNRTREIIDSDRPLWPIRNTPFWSDTPNGGCESGEVADIGLTEVAKSPTLLRSASIASGGAVALDAEHTTIVRRGDFAEAWIEFSTPDATPLTAPLSISVRLVDPDGGDLWAQADRTLSAARWNDDRGVALQLQLIPFAGEVPDTLDARIGLYQDAPDGLLPVPWSDGSESVSIGSVETDGWSRPVPRQGSIPFGDAMLLESSAVSVEGGEIRVELVWRAIHAYRSDYTISVHVEGQGWRSQHDGTPALGAIPTLKWLLGWRVRDLHSIELPPDAATDAPVIVSVAVYDAFSLESLPVTDAARVRAGEGERATIYQGTLKE